MVLVFLSRVQVKSNRLKDCILHIVLIPAHLKQSLEVRETCVHVGVRREQEDGRLHEAEVAGIGEGLVLNDHEQWSQQVTHALGVSLLQMTPHVRAHNVPEFRQVSRLLEEPVIEI